MNENEFENRLRSLFSELKREEPRGQVLTRILQSANRAPEPRFVPTPVVGISFALLLLLIALNLSVLLSSPGTNGSGDEQVYEMELLDGSSY